MSTLEFGTLATAHVARGKGLQLEALQARPKKTERESETMLLNMTVLGKECSVSVMFPEISVRIVSGDYDSGVMSIRTFEEELRDFVQQDDGPPLIGPSTGRVIRAGIRRVLFANETDPVKMTAAACVFVIFYAFQVYMWLSIVREDPVQDELKTEIVRSSFLLGSVGKLPFPFNVKGPIQKSSVLDLSLEILISMLHDVIPEKFFLKKVAKSVSFFGTISIYNAFFNTGRTYQGPTPGMNTMGIDIKYVNSLAYSFACKAMHIVIRHVFGASAAAARLFYYTGLLQQSAALAEGKVYLTNYVPPESKNYLEGGKFYDVITFDATEPGGQMVIVNFPEGHVENAQNIIDVCKTTGRRVFNPMTNEEAEEPEDGDLSKEDALLTEIKLAVNNYKPTEDFQRYDPRSKEWVTESENEKNGSIRLFDM